MTKTTQIINDPQNGRQIDKIFESTLDGRSLTSPQTYLAPIVRQKSTVVHGFGTNRRCNPCFKYKKRHSARAQLTSPSAIVPGACARGAVQQRQRRRRPRQCVRSAVATTAPLSRTPQNTVAAAIEDTSKAAVGTLRGGNRAELEETSWKRVHQKYRQKGGRSQSESYHTKQQEPFIASIIYLEKWPERDRPSVLPLVSFRRP